MKNSPVRMGVIGAGTIGKIHLRALKAAGIPVGAVAKRCCGAAAESPSIAEAALVDCWIDACYQSAGRDGERLIFQKP